ncbi:hypothetical protein METBIDRAFT_36542 [Metschnikowia bicuspidata var. bicuspidata NRRL YB-4993]|uniref:25S rRNA adenine-N(1) methyltransferase n=1 Tax=Metschnikowia bicuspidata var. bicuspidata NRRL YB-4993 TaxID=869754 RepID=A0A1A0HK77_9ASCO|nr:hypothetical protein METBIDRAFT_36542 [Metschnikowia bicuspidata var. bicuspidata NRRL YB-4993]OBA24406.1 hypothetical protein METBIDRAFT_36542 [Metschnikowia bicuspidata var. bicuspidata NRRL YB-4993]
MLRKPKTITTSKTAPKTLKPQKARQLIRRFHNLQKWKAILLKRLQLQYPDLDEKLYLKSLGSAYTLHYHLFRLPKATETTPDSAITDSKAPAAKVIECLARIDAEIDQRGGLHVYQMASTVGQDHQRGGDSLKWLVKWFEQQTRRASSTLEIGCLSASNAILTCGRFGDMTRIDLNSQSPQILQQDFMERPLPKSKNDLFDVISCSLVLNFVPSASQRGEMLHRMTQFLREPTSALFLVLPLPCLSNSRYFDRECLNEVMTSLGFEEVQSHEAKKVIYLLYNWKGKSAMTQLSARKKREIHSGPTRNNFYIDMNQK